MFSETDLEAAVAAGALSPEAVARFRAFMADAQAAPLVDEEHFRLLTGFNDIFVSIAAVLLLVSVAWIGNGLPVRAHPYGLSPVPGLLVAGTAWGLAEYFTARRRMALPSIILLIAFVGGVFAGAAGIVALLLGADPGRQAGAVALALCAAITAGAAWLHWRRFHVPITVAATAAAIVGSALALFASSFDRPGEGLYIAALIAGLCVFAVAMRWDMSDPVRQTRRSDVAFWLHLLAAPLIVHPVFHLLGLLDGGASIPQALVIILLYVALGIVALAIDRRALMVSALAYVLYALSELFRQFGAVSLSLALTALVIGSALLLLSAFWHTARGGVLARLPASLRARLPVPGREAPAPARA